ncbi:DUF885 domain-containing protein [Cellulomonas sp. Leaf395]|uniref:DUF885 domain-containing protein n=1 Tax=Cellulomonas sp. Leaf395 TaxID=1736362 RepID=UPI0006FD857B|nr:DUF885 domain-containing protein [Cellulomonas sp. Leaf395]KQT02469.1 hypothetical protein ASG23_03910 [Cellulomonas sp. Leaf395]
MTPTTPDALTERAPSPIDTIAEAYMTAYATLDPLAATSMGIAGHDHEMTDHSPAGLEARAELTRSTLLSLDGAAPTDEVDQITLAAMRERLGLELELHEAGEYLRYLNNIASPVQNLRDVFDIMPTDDVEAWSNIAARLNALPFAVDGYIESLRLAASTGAVAAVRQIEEAARQADELADPATSFFTTFITGAGVDAVLDESAACSLVRAELEHGATAARGAYATLAAFLRDELAPQAPQADAAGRERYALWSRAFLGATVDLEETYQWGLEELARVVAEQEAVAAQIAGPGATVAQAIAKLDEDPAGTLHGTAALQAWMQETSDAAIEALDGTHFDIPVPVLALECRIAPTQNGGIYYTGPSDDFSRPGRMWWSVPPEVTTFNTWREKTTVYHEGVPGHHLQIGQAVFQRATLNTWRRLACWTSGYGEGWALYAERLMADLGFLDDPGDRLGMLDGQRMRAARVVFDIGVHLGLEAPQEWGGGTWDADKGWEFLKANVNMPESFIRFEWNRYLGWPGQAPSYKIGQRLWEQTRNAAAAEAEAKGEEFDLRAFHARALSMGSLPLDVLRTAFAG